MAEAAEAAAAEAASCWAKTDEHFPDKINKIKPGKEKFESNEDRQHYRALMTILKHDKHSDREMLKEKIMKCKNKLGQAHNDAVKNQNSNRM